MTAERPSRKKLSFGSAATVPPEGSSRKRLNFRGKPPVPETGKTRVQGVEKVRAAGGAALSTEVAPPDPAATRRESAKPSPEAYNEGLRKLFEPGSFTLDASMDPAGNPRVFMTTKDGLRLNATDRFLPRPDESGEPQPATIIRRRPEQEGGDITFAVEKIYESKMGEPEIKVKLKQAGGPSTNVTVEELARPHPDNPAKYWDLRPPEPPMPPEAAPTA